MLEYLPKDVREGLEQARKRDMVRKARLRVRDGGGVYPVLRYWDSGFALDAAAAPHLRGLVDLYDGTRQLSQCLIVACAEDNGEMVYEFKRRTAVVDRAPLDYSRDDSAPVGLLRD